MARSIPTAMIFTSSTNGLSHTKEEDTPVEHLEMGCDAFWSLVNRVLTD
jgi:N-carbamoyl-L-amino-acid hydrolase